VWRDSRASLLAYNLASLCLGCEPKAKVATSCGRKHCKEFIDEMIPRRKTHFLLVFLSKF